MFTYYNYYGVLSLHDMYMCTCICVHVHPCEHNTCTCTLDVGNAA